MEALSSPLLFPLALDLSSLLRSVGTEKTTVKLSKTSDSGGN